MLARLQLLVRRSQLIVDKTEIQTKVRGRKRQFRHNLAV